MKKKLLHTPLLVLMLLPLSAYAEVPHFQATSSIATTTQEVTSLEEATSTQNNFILCSQEAIEVRDTRIASSRSLYNTAMTNALKDRKNKEKASVAILDENKKKDALKVSVNTYKNLVKIAQNNLTDAREEAWKKFENDIDACRSIEDEEISLKIEAAEEPVLMLMKEDVGGAKTIKDTIKEQFDVLRSLFN